MTTYEVGQTATVALKVYDATGALADLGGGNPTCTVTKPDGTTTAATVTKNSTTTQSTSISHYTQILKKSTQYSNIIPHLQQHKHPQYNITP